ncbi:hypothetical protein EYC84_001024 [Monilinia fructicola]|uniref:AGC-kinase C-terminal domain-containing protein n=1 Tax=Monilinia fructicola TaxID=38448 RepID=A0A5M9JKX6_MONFR|nr:hypothetical protein EYC84_001024 [Monilinia fructicola]
MLTLGRDKRFLLTEIAALHPRSSDSPIFPKYMDISTLPKLTGNTLRSQRAPFVPELDSETDAGYFDDFSNEADMAKEDAMSKSLFVGFTFRHRKPNTDDDGKASLQEKPSQLTALLGLCYEPIMILMIITTFDSIFDLGR